MIGEPWYRVKCINRLDSVEEVEVIDSNRSTVTLADGTKRKKTGRGEAYRPSRFEAVSWAVTVLNKQYDRAAKRAQDASFELGRAIQKLQE